MTDEIQEIIRSTSVAVLATINEDGSPYTTPITYNFESNKFTWKSSPDAVHSQNIVRDNRVSLSVVEGIDSKKRAIYINTTATPIGNRVFVEEWQQTLEDYEAVLGSFDSEKSTPGRFYFQGVTE